MKNTNNTHHHTSSQAMTTISRWVLYQKERFSFLQFVPMTLAFTFCALSYSAHLYGNVESMSILQYLVAFLTTLFFFMLMRIADEHKDFEEDTKFRPYRPVQRGLISLKELRNLGIILIFVQILLAFLLDTRLLLYLAIIYLWFWLMTVEFFVPAWLKTRHTLYLLSHMVIIPLIDLYATATQFVPNNEVFSFGIFVFMVSSYCDGTVIEVGRKLRAEENEEYGVDTYTQIWGPKKAMLVWLTCMTISFISTVIAASQVRAGLEIFLALLPLYIYACFISRRFANNSSPQNAKVFTIFPGIWAVLMYVLLGIVPFFK